MGKSPSVIDRFYKGAISLLLMASGCASRHLYWGDVHGHSAYSDGKGSVADYLTCARDVADLDFVMVTDHDFGHQAPWLLAQEEWDETQETAKVRVTDHEFTGDAYYYVRVTQADVDAHGNPSRAWSSPIWVANRSLSL